MWRQTFLLISLILGLACAASADLVGHWPFDEGTGSTAADIISGNDATFTDDPIWTAGVMGDALELDGAGDYLTIANSEIVKLRSTGTYSVAIWINVQNTTTGVILYHGLGCSTWASWFLGVGGGEPDATQDPETLKFGVRTANGGAYTSADTPLTGDVWMHVTATYDGSTVRLYVDGEEVSTLDVALPYDSGENLLIGGDSGCGGRQWFSGMIDELQIYDHALSDKEVQSLFKGAPGLASGPAPEDEITDVLRDTSLTWDSGDFAVEHDVYFGTVFDDVNDADRTDSTGVLVSQGQTDNSYDPGRLAFGETYFWRIDEVNGAPDNTIFKGDIWSFIVEPFSIPVEAITVTASSSNADNMGPENTINGVGLNALDQHSTEGTEMWLSGMGDPTPSIQYDFDQPYKLDEMLVWNSNQLIESFVGLGAKDVVIEYSADGVDWITLEGATQFAQASASPTYTANTAVNFGGALAKHVRITVNAGWGMLPQYGLSAVRFLYIPTFAREPQPAHGHTSAGADVVLSWRAGREAASHQVHLGTDAADLPLVGTVAENNYDAGVLDYDTTYYWQITEVNEAETPTAHAGPTWSFATPAFGTVDNFDQYDDKCNRIFFAWEDGLGHSGGEDIDGCDVPASNGNGGGSIVGNDTAPFAEQTIVAGGSQSLPFNYDNAFGPSEATLTLEGQDWTASGVQSLSIQFYGEAGNSGQLYVKINNTKVVYPDDAANIARAEWQAWVIDLSAVGGNLQDVTSLTIGVDGATAAGMLYIDEIGLYPKAAEYLTPVDPGNASLAGHWSFDEGTGDVAADGSGNGNNGTLVGAGWDTGQMGSAVVFDGMSSYVDIPAAAWNTIEQQATVAAWMYVDSSITQNPFTIAAFQDPAVGNSRVFSTHVLWGNTLYLDTGGTTAYDRINKAASAGDYADAWIHWAFTKNAETGEQKIYRNGILWHSGTGLTRAMTGVTVFILGANAATTGEFWNGSMDDLRLYNQELSQEEILWLAGRTSPVVKPF